MKRVILYSFIFAFSCCLAGCVDEDAITPSATPELIYGKYTLPQGNHDYDEKIGEYYRKYGVLLLYKFEEKDFWWNLTNDIRWKYDSVRNYTYAGYGYAPADEDYVGDQIELLETHFFNCFTSEVLQRMLPHKILLTGSLLQIPLASSGLPTDNKKVSIDMSSGYDYLAVNWGSEKVKLMTPLQINNFRAQACFTFLKRLLTLGKIEYSDQFSALTDYSVRLNATTQYNQGVFYLTSAGTSTINLTADWDAYVLRILSTPYSVLAGDGGILNPSIDRVGKIRQKYDIIISHYLNKYGIDLQRIGNTMTE